MLSSFFFSLFFYLHSFFVFLFLCHCRFCCALKKSFSLHQRAKDGKVLSSSPSPYFSIYSFLVFLFLFHHRLCCALLPVNVASHLQSHPFFTLLLLLFFLVSIFVGAPVLVHLVLFFFLFLKTPSDLTHPYLSSLFFYPSSSSLPPSLHPLFSSHIFLSHPPFT